jgi:hypothetical protein
MLHGRDMAAAIQARNSAKEVWGHCKHRLFRVCACSVIVATVEWRVEGACNVTVAVRCLV